MVVRRNLFPTGAPAAKKSKTTKAIVTRAIRKSKEILYRDIENVLYAGGTGTAGANHHMTNIGIGPGVDERTGQRLQTRSLELSLYSAVTGFVRVIIYQPLLPGAPIPDTTLLYTSVSRSAYTVLYDALIPATSNPNSTGTGAASICFNMKMPIVRNITYSGDAGTTCLNPIYVYICPQNSSAGSTILGRLRLLYQDV